MCGIIGVIDTIKSISENNIVKMRDALLHRGPDASGIWNKEYENYQIWLAHRRLSIIDLSCSANQPMVSNDGQKVLTFNGEIYNFKEIKKELESCGIKFRTNSDTEVVLNALDRWGTDALIKFHGPFALAFLNTCNRTLVLSRDRVGEKPLYYYYDGKIFAWASESKSFEFLPEYNKEINFNALQDYLTFGYIPSPKSIWKNVHKLPPAAYLSLELGREFEFNKAPDFFWKICSTSDNSTDMELKAEELRCLLKKVSKEMLVADVPLGVFLSGGVDSSGVVASLVQNGLKPETFNIRFSDQEFDESKYATIVADKLGLNNHIKLVVPNDIEVVFNNLVSNFDEPFNDFSYLPTYYVSKAAREEVTVCLSGDGSDEIFCGYQKYVKIRRLEYLNKFGGYKVRKPFVKIVSSIIPEYSDSKRQLDRLGFSDNDFLFDMLAIVFKPRELDKIITSEYKEQLCGYKSSNVVRDFLLSVNDHCGLVEKMRLLDIRMTLSEDMLVKVDRMSMANSLEVRPVFLHPSIIDFAFNLSSKHLVDNNTAKFILKKALEPWLPETILYRTKMGFGVPLKKWFFGDLKNIMDTGLSYLGNSMFNTKGIKTLMDNHLKGDRDFIMQIHALVFLGHWLNYHKVRL